MSGFQILLCAVLLASSFVCRAGEEPVGTAAIQNPSPQIEKAATNISEALPDENVESFDALGSEYSALWNWIIGLLVLAFVIRMFLASRKKSPPAK